MARIAGVDLPDDKRIDYALTKLYGVGWSASGKILRQANVDPARRMRQLTEDELSKINKALEPYTIEGDLVRQIRGNIQRLADTGSYRGTRHAKGLPVRGQRTRTNARTKRGKRKTVGAFKKQALARTTAGTRGSKG